METPLSHRGYGGATDLKVKGAKLEGRVKEVLAELNRNQASTSLIKDLADLYLEQYVAVQNRHPKSKENRVKLVVQELGHIPVSELTVFDVTSYMSRKKRTGTGNATVNRDVSALKHMLGWALDQGLIASNPIRQLKKLREERKLAISDDRIPILEGAIQATLSHLRPECEPVFRFIYETGCRREEALSLKHSQAFLPEKLVVLPKTKAGQLRYIALTQAAA